jgi:hypothetical protein
MNDKYYIPDISEFYFGFEYQTNYDRKGDWRTFIFDSFNEYVDVGMDGELYEYTLQSEIDSGEIRVKYLDREDIENLGFKKMEKNNWVGWHDYYLKDTLLGSIPYYLYCTLHVPIMDNNYKIIVHRNDNYNKIEEEIKKGESEVVYVGNIKNKSELKKLLKMLYINE